MRKVILILVLSIYSLNLYGQTTSVEGFLKQYKIGDSLVEMNEYFSTEIYDAKGEQIFEQKRSLDPESEIDCKFSFFIENSNNVIKGWTSDGDSSIYQYIKDTINNRNYIISNQDTAFIYETQYDENKNLTSEKCIHGCKYFRLYSITNFNKVDTIFTIWEDGDTTFTIYIYDLKERIILYKDFLRNPSDTVYPYISYVYNDIDNIRIEEYGNTGSPENVEIITIKYDKNRIPIYKTIEYHNESKYTYWRIEYFKQ